MTSPGAEPAGDFSKSWRYRLGLGLLALGHVILVLGLLSPALGLGASIAGAMILGGEVVGLTSIVFLGKEGFKAIKVKLFGFLKVGFAAPVGRTRHRIGIALLCTNVVTMYASMFYAWTAFKLGAAEDQTLVVWGLDVGQQASMVFWLFLIGELSFLCSLYVLGADWWGWFRDLFVWKEPSLVES